MQLRRCADTQRDNQEVLALECVYERGVGGVVDSSGFGTGRDVAFGAGVPKTCHGMLAGGKQSVSEGGADAAGGADDGDGLDVV